MTIAPTKETYEELQVAFEHFNRELFGGVLKAPIFTLQREKRFLGFCSKHRFISSSSKEMVDEIAMNPSYFAVRTVRETLSTLVHEMVHSWQFHYGKPGRRGYHNKEWGSKMKEVGLHPSETGAPGGKETGERMTHYIIEGGAFDRAVSILLGSEFKISWLDRFPAREPLPGSPGIEVMPHDEDDLEEGIDGSDDDDSDGIGALVLLPPDVNKSNRVKFKCPKCADQAWGKPGLAIACLSHDQPERMEPTG